MTAAKLPSKSLKIAKCFTVISLLFFCLPICHAGAINQKVFDNPDTIVVARDGTGMFRNISEAIDVCRAFMDYHKVIYIKKGLYKEKIVVSSWLTNIELVGEDRDETIISYDDHANIVDPTLPNDHKLGTSRSYTLKIDGTDITLRNLTVENNAPRIGQAVALHTDGDRLRFINCRFLGNQDTIYTGGGNARNYFKDCYIEGTTDFIFGPATAWFEGCEIKSLSNSYVTAASTPADRPFGYVFNNCRLTHAEGVTKCYLGRPWRPYAYVLFMNCEIGGHILPVGWHNWNKASNEKTARYMEYNNHGEGAVSAKKVDSNPRAPWSRQLTKKEAAAITPDAVFNTTSAWDPTK